MSTRLHDVEQALATFRGLQRDLEGVRKDFLIDGQTCLPTELTDFHLRRQLTELERQIRGAVRSTFGESSAEYQAVQDFGGLAPGHRAIPDYFHVLDRLVFGLEQERLRLLETSQDRRLAGIDAMTDFYTADLLLRLLEQEIAWASRKGETVGLVLLRVAEWSRWQCAVPPAVRKEIIIAIASLLKTTLRPYDLVCRMGDAEFALVLREADASVVGSVSNRIVHAFTQITPRLVTEPVIRLELAASVFPFDAERAMDLLARTQPKVGAT